MTVLEIGPATVRRLPSDRHPPLDPEMVAQALGGIDDTTVLLGERPVAVDSLWRRIVSSSVGRLSESVTLVHPSWWPPGRVARILESAASVTAGVIAQPRSTLLARQQVGANALVVEIGTDVVAICRGTAAPTVLRRSVDVAALAADEIAADAGAPILIDAPQGVYGADELALVIRKMLLDRRIAAEITRIEDAVTPVGAEPAGNGSELRSWLPAQFAAAAAVAVLLGGVGVATTRPAGPAAAVVNPAVGLAEGHAIVHVPADWRVVRITAGPGSRRVEVISPVDPAAALHVTQSYAPGQTLDTAAQQLREAVADQPPGIFVDFNPNDVRADRRVVSYREVRMAHHVRWFVVYDGSTRISIGCQSPAGREHAIDGPCDDAVGSAREIAGTG